MQIFKLIHREGYIIILVTIAISATLLFLSSLFFGEMPIIKWAIFAFAFFLTGMVLQFFRNPPRPVANPSENIVLAPCDGKVVVVETADEPEYLGDKRIQVSIFMSPLNVHVNRNPISGKFSYVKYHAGKFLMAWEPKSSTENERNTVVIETSAGKQVLFRQIAGFLARRIISYARAGQSAQQGADMGFIRFGSRVDIFLPLDAKILVKPGDIATGNVTKIAEI